MKSFKVCLLALSFSLCPGAVKAEQVDWAALGNNIQQLNGSLLTNAANSGATGSTLLLGHFTTGFTFSQGQSYQTLLAAFTTYDTSFIGEGQTTAGQFSASTFTPGVPTSTTLPGAFGDQLYMWFFNSSNPANATQWAIVTNTAWVRPVSGTTPASNAIIDASDLGTFVPTGAPGTIRPSPDPTSLIGDVRLSAIPEPSTYALALVGLGVAAGIARRRRQAVG